MAQTPECRVYNRPEASHICNELKKTTTTTSRQHFFNTAAGLLMIFNLKYQGCHVKQFNIYSDKSIKEKTAWNLPP